MNGLEASTKQSFWKWHDSASTAPKVAKVSGLVCWWCEGPIHVIENLQPLCTWHDRDRIWHYNCWCSARLFPIDSLEVVKSSAARAREPICSKNSVLASLEVSAPCRICGTHLSGPTHSRFCKRCQSEVSLHASSSDHSASAHSCPPELSSASKPVVGLEEVSRSNNAKLFSLSLIHI